MFRVFLTIQTQKDDTLCENKLTESSSTIYIYISRNVVLSFATKQHMILTRNVVFQTSGCHTLCRAVSCHASHTSIHCYSSTVDVIQNIRWGTIF